MPDLPVARSGEDEAFPASGSDEGLVGTGNIAPLCSIIIPVFDNCFYTRLCLEALRQSRAGEPPHEIIVVDNGSTDDTTATLAEFGDEIHKVFKNDENLGFARASNLGATLSRGRYLVFLNNDVVVQSGWLKALVSAAEWDGNIGAVGARLLYPDGTIQHAGIVFAPGPIPYHAFAGQPRDWPGALMQRDYQAVTGACMLVDRQLFEAVGGFNDGYQNVYEDIDFCFKIRQMGRRVVYNPNALAHHFESATVGRYLRDDHSSVRFREHWADKVVIDFEPSTRTSSDVRGAGSLMHLEVEALAHRVRDLTAQNFQLLSMLANSPAAAGSDSGIKVMLASLFRPFDVFYCPGHLSPAVAGTTVQVPVVVINLGTRTFEGGTLRLSYHWRRLGEPDYLVWNGLRTAVEAQLEPGRPVSVSAVVLLPNSSGYYFLEWDAIQEGVAWMSQRGVAPYRQLVAVQSAPGLVASIEGLPAMIACRSTVEVQVLLKGKMENRRQSELSFGWRWLNLDRQDGSAWEPETSAVHVDADMATLSLSVKAPWRSGCYLLEVGQRRSGGTWMPLETIGGACYVLAGNGRNQLSGEENRLGEEPEPTELSLVRHLAERKWLPGEAEYCLARIEQLVLPTGPRLEAARLQSLLAECAHNPDKEGWPGASRAGELEWAIRRWLAEVAEIDRQLCQERKRANRLANMVDSYRKNRLRSLLALLDRLPFRGTQHRGG